MEAVVINVKNLPEVPNVCNQRLKEILKSEDFSIAYVEMAVGNISRLHKHKSFTEFYYILEGRGVLCLGKQEIFVNKDFLVEIKPGTAHQLKNTGLETLRHLVISVPSFNPEDVILCDEN